MKRNIIIAILSTFIAVYFSSCLKYNLPEVANSASDTLTAVNFQHRYFDTTYVAPGTIQADTILTVRMVQLNTSSKFSNDTVYCSISIPGNFPAKQKNKVSLKNIWAYFSVPDASIVVPLNGAPKLGTPGDYSIARKYMVKAANEDAQTYVIVSSMK